MKIEVYYIGANTLKKFKNVKTIDRFLIFGNRKELHIALKTTEALVKKNREIFFVYEHDQNTFDPKTNKVLSDTLNKEYRKFLKENSPMCYYTRELKPDDLTPHHVIEEINRMLVDGQLLANIIQKIHKVEKTTLFFAFMGGMGAGVILLMFLGVVSPDVVYIRIGGG